MGVSPFTHLSNTTRSILRSFDFAQGRLLLRTTGLKIKSSLPPLFLRRELKTKIDFSCALEMTKNPFVQSLSKD